MQRIFLLIFLLFLNFLQAEVLEVGLENTYTTKAYMTYTLAHDINETPEMLVERKWEVNKNSFNTSENKEKAYWAKLNLKNFTSLSKTYYLKSENQFTYHIEFFLLKGTQIIDHIEDGIISPNKSRIFNSNHIIFPIILAPYEETTVFFKIQNYNKIDLDFSLDTKEYLLDFYQTYSFVEGLFFGGMLMMILYNLFLYVLLKNRAYLYYVFYTFWVSIYFFGFFGFFHRYFQDFLFLFHISPNLFLIFMILFMQSILSLKEQLPRVNQIFNILIGYYLLTLFCYLFFLYREEFLYAETIFNIFFIVLGLSSLLVVGITYYLGYVKKDAIAKIYAVIWSLLALGGIALGAVYLNLIEFDIHMDYLVQFIILFEVLFFAFILSFKIKLIEQEKERQDKILLQQNKLASMGEMISTIAHQWRQPLSEINGVVLSMDLDYRKKRLSQEKMNNYLNDLEDVTAYLSNTIGDFMNFFNTEKKLEVFYISEVFATANRMLFSSLKGKVQINISLEKEFKMRGYSSELLQIILITVNNAVDACISNEISIPNININVRDDGEGIILIVEDNAGGIPMEIIENIFNPYFTTKHKSKGTGLGLYILKMIVEESMHGRVEVFNGDIGIVCRLSILKDLGNFKSNN